MKKKLKVVHMVTVASSINLMKGQLKYLVDEGYDVTVISSEGERLEQAKIQEKVNTKAIKMERTISPINDVISLFHILKYFARIKPDICNAGTPKAGLLGMLAAWIMRVPVRIYTVRGLPFEGSKGIKRKILIATEKVACSCATKVICISPSVQSVVINEKITSFKKTIVFGEGSSNGIQVNKYVYNDQIRDKVDYIKNSKGLTKYEFIIGYVGRINNFKGVKELVNVFEMLQKEYKHIGLMLVGAKEKKDAISEEVDNKILKNPDIIEIGLVQDPVPYYYTMDILAFPTYREGFGNVSIEAQATGTPVVTTNATGAVDTVIDGSTGFIVDIANEKQLKEALEKFINSPELIDKMGKNARKRAIEKFDSQLIWQNLSKLYSNEISIRMKDDRE